ncbi:portal protein [Staphylococcus phage PG-2021_4]
MAVIDNVLNGFIKNRRKQAPNMVDYSPSGRMKGLSITGTHFGGSTKIDEEDALSISAVMAASELIASTIARLNINLTKKGPKGSIETVDDNRAFLLNKEPNNLMNATTLKKRIVMDYLFYGNSYLYPEKVRNDVTGIHHLKANRIMVDKYLRDGFIEDAIIKYDAGGKTKEFDPYELIIILKNSDDGVQSEGILNLSTDLLLLAIEQQKYNNSILQNGALPLATLSSPHKLSDESFENLKESWATVYQGGENAGKTVILEEGLEYKPVSLNPNELDLSSSRKYVLSDIARIFNLPESMINADANKYASNEQNNLHFLQYTLKPIISAIESSLDKSLLLEDEKKEGYHFEFDVREVLATTEKEKFEATNVALKGGIISGNEARMRHGYETLLDDFMNYSLANVFYDKKTGDMIIPNMGIKINPKDPESLAQAKGSADNIPKEENAQDVDAESEDKEIPVKDKKSDG